MTILGLAESFKVMNRPDPTVTNFDGLFLGNMKDRDVKFLHNHHSRLQFVLLKLGIDISDSLETMRFSAT